jgi:hypothetical protein
MKILNIIIEIITSPFTLLFRTKAQKNSGSKNVNMIFVFLFSLLVVLTILFFCYYERLFAK